MTKFMFDSGKKVKDTSGVDKRSGMKWGIPDVSELVGGGGANLGHVGI